MANKGKKLTDILANGNGGNFGDKWNNTQAADEFGPLPPGEYTVRILNGELFTSRRKSTPGYKLTCEVIDGEHEGRRLWLDFWLTPAALPMTKRDLAKIGVEQPDQMERPLPPGILLKVKVTLRRDDDDNEVNRVTRFDFIGIEPGDAFEPKGDDGPAFDPVTLDNAKEPANGEQLEPPQPKDSNPTNNGTLFPSPSSDAGPYAKGGDKR